MDEQELKDQQREAADDALIDNAFKHLLDTYLASRHRQKDSVRGDGTGIYEHLCGAASRCRGRHRLHRGGHGKHLRAKDCANR